MAKTIQFTASGSCNALGNFAPGDIARNVPDELARHLVKEVGCAEYAAGITSEPMQRPTEQKKPARLRKSVTSASA